VRERFAFSEAAIRGAGKDCAATPRREAVILSPQTASRFMPSWIRRTGSPPPTPQFLLDYHQCPNVKRRLYCHAIAAAWNISFKSPAPGFHGPGRNGNPRPVEKGLRHRLQHKHTGALTSSSKSLQCRQTNPHGNQHPARQRFRQLRRRGIGRKNFQLLADTRDGPWRGRSRRKNRPRLLSRGRGPFWCQTGRTNGPRRWPWKLGAAPSVLRIGRRVFRH